MNLEIKKIKAPGSEAVAHLHRRLAFTLMEVMIAIGVFCVGVFAILGLVASVMHGARLLDKPMVDAGVVVSQIAQTNQLIEVRNVYGNLSEFLDCNLRLLFVDRAADLRQIQSE